MPNPLDYPVLLFPLPLMTFWLAASLGAWFHQKTLKVKQEVKQDSHDDFVFVLGGTLTLLGMIIGFTFSMAVTRYDTRKTLEEAEANAIGTEYLRADLLPDELGARTRDLLRQYLDLRIALYQEADEDVVKDINQRTAKLQGELWASVLPATTRQPTPIVALAVAGMNDVINSQGYTQAAWWNRIPVGAWTLMALMAISCNLLVGYGERRKGALILFVLPVIVSIAFFLIADLDSPRGGVIRVHPQNLGAVLKSLPPR